MGQFLFGKSNWLHYRVTTMEAEAIGLLEAIKTAVEKGMHYVEFETDCKPVADALSLPTAPHSELEQPHSCHLYGWYKWVPYNTLLHFLYIHITPLKL